MDVERILDVCPLIGVKEMCREEEGREWMWRES